MCGLAGLVLTGERRAGDGEEALVRRMCDIQAYRGPDDSGTAVLGRIVLGSRRLAILDLSPAGHMPMGEPGGRWWIAYNGEVFNFAEIRTELESLGHVFRSRTDTEVILHAFMQWGTACMHRFVGMFAFAIADTASGDVTLVRDRYGIKPLYYARSGDAILFASEMKSLVQVLGPQRVDRHSLLEWMLYRNVDSLTPETLIEGISSVLPGQVVHIRNGALRTESWYSPLDFVQESEFRRFEAATPGSVVDEVDRALNEAVRLRLISDVPVGTLLSGGLDSSLVTAIAGQYTRHLSAFHVSVEGFPKLDERKYAEHLAGKLDIPFIPLSLTGQKFRQALPTAIYLSDLPLSHPNTIAYYLISRLAREHGVIVLLSGEGADELFGGYLWNYRRKRNLLRLQKWLDRVPDRVMDLLSLLVYSDAGLPVTVRRFREVLSPTVAFLDRQSRRDWQERCADAYRFENDPIDREVLGGMLADLSDFLTPLLRRLDRASMGASVESRVPFLDHRLVHRAINMPLDYKVGKHADKWVLKQVARRYIPDFLVDRKKAGFPLPFDAYLEPLADLRLFDDGFCQHTLGLSRRALQRSVDGWRAHVFGFFGLLTLELWGRIHLLGEPIASLDEKIAMLEHEFARRSGRA
jgi:asparagine synthase (glutamine-hydrolysing)